MAVKDLPQDINQSSQSESAMTSQAFYYSPWRYLQTMFSIAWAAFAHPFSSTVIDLATGTVRHGAAEDVPGFLQELRDVGQQT